MVRVRLRVALRTGNWAGARIRVLRSSKLNANLVDHQVLKSEHDETIN